MLATLAVAALIGYGDPETPFVLPPAPPPGWGFPATSADGIQWHPIGCRLPICQRDDSYYFPGHHAVPPIQMLLPQYLNPYTTRCQAYLPYGCASPRWTPAHPYQASLSTQPLVPVPSFAGKEEAKPITSSSVDLAPR